MAKCCFKMRCRCSFSKAKFFKMSISKSVNFPCLKISGSINDKSKIKDRSCLTS